MAAKNTGGGMMLGYLIAGGLLALFVKKAAAKTPAPAPAAPAPYNPFPLPAPIDAVDAAAGEIPGSMAPAVGPVTAAAAIWSNLTPTSAPSGGYVNFPSGSQSGVIFLPWATDSAGNLYTQWAGQIYIVNPNTDFLGNLSARLLGS